MPLYTPDEKDEVTVEDVAKIQPAKDRKPRVTSPESAAASGLVKATRAHKEAQERVAALATKMQEAQSAMEASAKALDAARKTFEQFTRS